MDRRLLNHYNTELAHLRQMGAEFAQQFPKIAGRLALDREAKEICQDPFVERLLEGFAFLTARIRLKLDAEFPRFTQAMLETIYPHYLCPTPSMAVVRFEPAQITEGFSIPRGTALKSTIGPEEHTPCDYRTAHEVRLWPIRLIEARYFTRDIAELELPRGLTGRAAFRIRLQSSADVPLKAIPLGELTFFLRGTDELPVAIYEQIFSQGSAVVVRGLTEARIKPAFVLPRANISRVGFREDEALLPYGPRGFSGYRLLHEYFACPQRFLFFKIEGLQDAIRSFDCDQMDLIIVLDEQDVRLENRVDVSNFELFCAPAINLFPRRADRISLADRVSEFHVVVDRTRPIDFEIYQVEAVTGHGESATEEQQIRPFYLARDLDLASSAFYTVNRVPRVLSEKERKFGQVTSYSGGEIFLSLVDASDAPYRSNLQELGVKVLCSNRHLPIRMAVGAGRTDFTLDVHAPVATVKCVTTPTSPRPPFAEGARAWRIINHLSLNYLSLLDHPGEGAVALRDLLGLYAEPENAYLRKQIKGLRSVTSKQILRRATTPGPIAFARGLEIDVLFDESAYEGTGVFLIGAVLEQFFARYVSLNSFTETVIRTDQRGEIMRWPTRLGNRHLT
ncbi:MAG TPA: type VI secretion system baseplate subunit TssF [Terrimicrobiaceae bacterium]